MIRNFDNICIARNGQTSICRSSVMNLENNPRVLGMEEKDVGFGMGSYGTELPAFSFHGIGGCNEVHSA